MWLCFVIGADYGGCVRVAEEREEQCYMGRLDNGSSGFTG